jgi:hypothetical protein
VLGIDLSVAIQHAPWIPERRVNVAVMLGEVPGAEVIRDFGDGFWPTRRRAWYSPGGTHRLVMDDDLQLSRNFLSGLREIISLRPRDIISLFTVRRGALDAPAQGSHWCVSWDGLCGAAIVMPTDLVWDFLRWEEKHVSPNYLHDDTRIVQWALHANDPPLRTYTPVPCLVQHLDIPSLIDSAAGIPRAPAFCEDAAKVDWSQGLSNPRPIGASVSRNAARVR